MAQLNITLESDIVKGLFLSHTPETLVPLMESILNQFLEAQATESVGTTKNERSEGIDPAIAMALGSAHSRPGSDPLCWTSPVI